MIYLSHLRLLMLPVKDIDAALPKNGLVYEIGSGLGVLAHALGSAAPKRNIIGIDCDRKKLTKAHKVFGATNVAFEKGDAVTYPYQDFVGAVLSDFLHHVDYKTQEAILRKIIKAIKKNGVLVIKEIDKNDGLLMLASRIWDLLFYPQDKIYYRGRTDWYNLLKRLGLVVNVSRKVPWFPGSTHLFICRKI